ncbi:3-oxoacyl-[acyl-carrier protein] reductase [Patulibacter medicamentivorans]|uniref:3-oxoacyl-[acyl-carrier protein] reductase n=1 Tax=Patulibacter medicamentivorans TaxID=1097667 RepID=H0E7V3_9ACTN|nr:SDR family oxidoreductase [Patulibacter medicamentivorans]EHN10243.1 3-oxoacyl-[acyl-carrier protein] reductase [Patulibacter medicamentivorans]
MTVRRAIVTGGASGIGAGTAERLASAGTAGVVLDREPAPTLPAGWTATAVDVTDAVALGQAIDDAVGALGGLDLLVAAAGVVPPWQPTGELDLADYDRTMAVNARGVVVAIEHAAPALAAGSGAIVVVGSLNSWRGDPNLTAYAASKHAVLGVVRSAALSLGPRGIRVNAVAPGPVATAALRRRLDQRAAAGGPAPDEALSGLAAGTALGRIATIDDVVDAIEFLGGPRSAAITGHLLPVDGGIA